MSQVSDVVLANQGFASFRTELNNIFDTVYGRVKYNK